MTTKVQGIELRIFGSGTKYAVAFDYSDTIHVKNVPSWAVDVDQYEETFDSPEAAIKAKRDEWTLKLETLIAARDKAKMWGSVLDSREEMVNAARLLRGGFDLATPGIMQVMREYK